MKRISCVLLGGLLAASSIARGDGATDHRFHVTFGALAGSDTIALTPAGANVELTPSFAVPAAAFTPDPYAGRCRLTAVKYTLKPADQKELLGDAYKAPDPDADDPLVLHPFELQNAAAKLGANAIYLLLNESEDLKNVSGLHDCTILSKDGDRYRGESLNEVSCQDASGKARKFSEYAARASFYACGKASSPTVKPNR
jgi:hypothetical protein